MAVAFILLPQIALGQDVLLRGHVASSRKADVSDAAPVHLGMYTFRPDGTQFARLSGDASVSGAFGGLWQNGYYYQSNAAVRDAVNPSVTYPGIVRFDASTWTLLETTRVERYQLSMDLVDDNGVVYGCFYDPSMRGCCWARMSMEPTYKYPYTYIKKMEMPMSAVAVNRDGQVFGIGDDGVLYRIDKNTGAATIVGATDVIPSALSSAAIDQRTGLMYWTCITNRNESCIYEVNTDTGKARKLATLPYYDQIVGLDVVYEPDAKAPAVPVNLTADFPNGSRSGNVTFRVPGTTADGTIAAGDVDFTLFANGVEVASGTVPYGTQVTRPLEMDSDAHYEFRVRLTNSVGDSHKAATAAFIGNDIPKAPANPTISYASGKFTVKWTAVTAGNRGGFIDKAQMRYRVTRMPDNVVVADNLTAVTLTDPVAIPDNYTVYSYKVEAMCNGKTSAAAVTNKVGLGTIQPPYLETFDNAASLLNYTIIDGNADNKKWAHFASSQIVRCNFTANKAQDDWLVTPAIRLEAGKAYLYSFDAAVFNDAYGEHFELKLGTAPTAAAMTTTLISDTEVKSKGGVTYERYITVPETGDYYVGLHAISASPKTYLQADNFAIAAPLSSLAPGLCKSLTVSPDASGSRVATIRGAAPATTLGGDNLAQVSKIELYRDTVLLTTLTGIAPGANFTFEDKTAPSAASYIYSAIAYNAQGEGARTRTQAFVGVKRSKPVTDVKITEVSDGVARITWTAPTQDVDGAPLPAGKVHYTLVQANKSALPVIVDSLTTTTYDWAVTDEGQAMANVAVIAVTDGGSSDAVASAMIPVGKAYGLPFAESFAAKRSHSALGTRNYNLTSVWTFAADGDLVGITSADNDNGYIYARTTTMGPAASMLFTGKIDLRQAENPYFSFFVYNLRNATSKPDNTNIVELMVRVVGEDDDFRQLSAPQSVHSLCDSLEEERWFPVRTDLSAFKGKVIQLGIKATVMRYQYNIFDKLTVGETYARNVSVDPPVAPARIRANVPFTVSVPVRNLGTERASGYTVELYRTTSDAPLASNNTGASIPTDSVVYVDFPATLSLMDSTAVGYYAKVSMVGDMDAADNISETATVRMRHSDKPAPRQLMVTKGGDGRPSLSWSIPELGNLAQKHDVVDDFDSYDAFTHTDIGDWVTVDGDRQPVGSISGVYVPSIIAGKTLASFFIFDRDGGAFNSTFDAHSGTRFLATFFRQDDGKVDDWAISPLLSGDAQPITLWAKSYNAKYPETFEVLYSTAEGADTAAFTLLDTKARISNVWTQYTFDLPAGARRFAIRSVSTGAFLLMVDDVAYTAAPSAVSGYHIYRDGQRLTTEPVSGTTYSDTSLPADSKGTVTYQVTAMYGAKESDASNRGDYSFGIGALQDSAPFRVVGGIGSITILTEGGLPVTVTSVGGVRIHGTLAAPASLILGAAPGIYIVRAGSHSAKVLVR